MEASDTPASWLIFADRQGVGERLAAILRSRRQACTLVYAGDALREIGPGLWELPPENAEAIRFIVRRSGGFREHPLSGVVHLWSLDVPETEIMTAGELVDAHRFGCQSVLPLVQALAGTGADRAPTLWLATRGSPSRSRPRRLPRDQPGSLVGHGASHPPGAPGAPGHVRGPRYTRTIRGPEA